jgi:hypothetical protein
VFAAPLHPYFAKEVVLASKHRKLDLIAPAFSHSLEIRMIEIAVDTDQLGTFSGEIERVDPPLETAIKKARLGIETSGIPVGIASEGSIGPDPLLPWIQSDYELVVFVDSQRDLVISETFRSNNVIAASIELYPDAPLEDFLHKADFPRHALIAQPAEPISPAIYKGIVTSQELHAAIRDCSDQSRTKKVRIQSDLRAMHSPSRQENIKKAAELLAARVTTQCPDCATPGWGRVGYEFGVCCSDCGQENAEAVRLEILGCYKCDKKESGRIINVEIDPGRCNYCNP